MKASFIIRFHSKRLDNLNQTLRFLEKWHRSVISESQLVLVCQDSTDRIANGFERYDHFNLELDCMRLPRLTNFGVEKSLAEKIVLLDGDRIAPAGYYQRILDQLEKGKIFSIKTMHNLSRQNEDWEIERCKYDYFVDERGHTTPGQRCMWSGNTAFMKTDFYRVGMMDEDYKGYGFEDQDMSLTMEKHGIEQILIDEEEIHLWHERKTYGVGDQKQLFIDNGLRFCKKWDIPLPDFLREEISNHKKAWI